MIFIVIACFYSYLISSSRFENSNQSTIHGIARYFGESLIQTYQFHIGMLQR